MGWIEHLYNTYELHEAEIMIPDRNGITLMPIAHTQQSAQIECTISNQGEFISAKVLDKKDSMTLIPCTIDSSSRSGSDPAPHPMFDKLKYIAKDMNRFTDEKSIYDRFIHLLGEWCKSRYAHPKVVVLYKYLEKGTLTKELINEGVLHCDDSGKLLKKWTKDTEKPDIFKVITEKQEDAFIRFRVGGIEDLDNNIWMNKEISNSYIQFYLDTLQADTSDLCYITGKVGLCVDKFPSKIRNSADMAKLISSNDKDGFTYRGRLATPQESLSIGYEASQKAINALKWLIEKQGKKFVGGNLVYVSWGTNNANFIDFMQDSYELFSQLGEEMKPSSTYEEFAKQFNSLISGYTTKHLKDIDDSIIIMGLDSATKGRLSIIYYLEAKSSELLQRIKFWHTTCSWLYKRQIKDSEQKKKKVTFISAPSPEDIMYAAYGEHIKDSLVKMTIKRIVKCITEGYSVPQDIVNSVYARLLNNHGLDKDEYEKLLFVSCALIRKSLNDRNGKEKEEEWIMGLDTARTDNDYISGRLLAYAHEIESYAIRKMENEGSLNGRETNAQRYMKQYQMFPKSTWYLIYDKLQPYIRKLRSHSDRLVREMNELMSNLNFDTFQDKPLDKKFILAYSAQLTEFETRRMENAKKRVITEETNTKKQTEERGNEYDEVK